MKKRKSISSIGQGFIITYALFTDFLHFLLGTLSLAFILPIPIVAQAIGGAATVTDIVVSTAAVAVNVGFFTGLPGRLRSRFTVTLVLMIAQWFVSFLPELGGVMAFVLAISSTIRTVFFIRQVNAEDAEYNKKQMPT